jgi:hypothetical protein
VVEGGTFFVWGIFPERYEVGGHMIYQNNQLNKLARMGTFPFPVSTISVSGLRFLAFLLTWVRRSEKCQSNDPP